jgi:inosose dehydratase
VHGDPSVPLSLRRPFPAQRWPEYADKLDKVATHALQEGVQLAYHHHMGTVIQTAEEIDELMHRTGPQLGLLLDSGHCLFAGGNPVAVAKRWAHRINHVHCKDIRKQIMVDAKNRNLSFLNAVLNGVFTVPGDGCVDYPSLFAVLKEHSYHGWLVVEAEQDPAVANPLTYAKLGHRNLQAMASIAGLI